MGKLLLCFGHFERSGAVQIDEEAPAQSDSEAMSRESRSSRSTDTSDQSVATTNNLAGTQRDHRPRDDSKSNPVDARRRLIEEADAFLESLGEEILQRRAFKSG